MAKRQNKKRFSAKHNPIGLSNVSNSSNAVTMDELPGKTPAIVLKAVEKLTSATVEERECGCNMIASLVSNSGAIELLLQQNVIRILGPLVKDSSVNVRLAALGALRNISVDGHFEVCDKMVELDVMTPLVLLLREYDAQWTLADKSTRMNDVLIQAINLLWNLCESSETAVKIFNQENLDVLLLPKIDPHKFGYEIALPTVYCLQTVSEDNKNLVGNGQLQDLVISLLNQPQETANLDNLLIKVLLIGLLHNITSGSLQTQNAGSMIAPAIQQLSQIISHQIDSLADEMMQKWADTVSNGVGDMTKLVDGAGDAKTEAVVEEILDEEEIGETDEMGEEEKNIVEAIRNVDERETSKHKDLELYMKRLTNVITAKQFALELLSNLCCSDDDSEDWEEMDDCSDAEMDQMDMIADQPGDETVNPISVSSDLHSLLMQNNVIDDVITACLVSEQATVQKICADENEELQSIAKQFRILQERALLCLNNMAATMKPDSLGGQKRVLELWKAVSQLISSEQVKSDADLLESVTSCIRALAQKLAEMNAPVFQEVSESDLTFLYQLAHHSTNTNIRIHTVRTVATIGCMLAKINPPHPMMKPIGVFLLVICMKDADLIVVAETLDAIFDVFAEDHLDCVAVEIGLVHKLKQFAPVFKSKIKQQKSRYRDHMAVISSAKTNLSRFIKYKNG